ncbi:MAG: BamA/TamA family outer membrane protein [Bacteroidales bacterium]|nr:BamA/TamA family outer membrane protein [Bacteroidales bacterium]
MNLLKISYIKFVFLLTFFSCLSAIAYSQQTKVLTIHNNETETKVFKALIYKKEFPDKQELIRELLKVRFGLFEQGYIAARFDTLIDSEDTLRAYLTIDKRYELAYLGKGNLDENVWRELITKKEFISYEVFRYNAIKKLFENIITYYENNGHPYVSISFDSLTFENNIMHASLKLKKGNIVKIDSIIIKGSSRIRKAYIYNYLNIKPGDPYNESMIRKISKRIEEIPFLTEKKPFEISFTDNGAWVYLYLDKKKASRFDGILGVMPNNETSGKLLLTGDVNLNLNNAFKWGEVINFNWRKLEQNTQDLKFNLIYPFIFSTPFVIDYNFSLFKKDSLYYTANNVLGLQYHFAGNNFLKIFVDYWNSYLISTYGLENANVLPDYADINTKLWGLSYHIAHHDYLYNPLSGFHIDIKTSAGNKTIKKNENVNQDLYENLDLISVQFNIVGDAGVFIPVAKKTTLWLRSQTAYLNNDNLFENELYRIGGMRILRGFDEESIYASMYTVFTFEFRYLFEKNSFFNIFWDGAYYERNTRKEQVSDNPFGFGAGMSFETKAGIFSIMYALGKQFDNPIDMKSAKIHFGIISTF